jgi:nicotinate-nucleotide--dimethylbenzimidazole phosphoribosyltransferase
MNETPTASLTEIRDLLSQFSGPDQGAANAAAVREKTLTKPRGSLGLLEGLAEWVAGWQGRHPPRLERPRVAVFAGNHGVARHGISAYPAEVTAQMVENFQNGGAAVNQLCQTFDAELRVYEMALECPTADFTEAPALSAEECARAMAYGMMSVEEGVDVICLGEMGIGNTTSAAAVSCALFGGEPHEWTGPGTGVADDILQRKIDVVAAGLAQHENALGDPFEIMRCLGGHELAAIVGAVIAARIGRVPVILDGYTATAAAAVLHKIDDAALDHCIVGHLSAEPPHRRLLELLGKSSLLDLDMRLGEASGAVMALGILRGAIACHNGMASFAEAKVSEKI